LTADMKRATVTVEAFEVSSTRFDRVVQFDVPTDRALLGDVSQSFQLSTRSLRTAKRTRDLDLTAAEDSADRADSKKAPNQGGDKRGEFEGRYDGQKQEVTGDQQNGGELRVAEPRQGQVVTFYVKSLVKGEQIGVVVLVNGKSTLYEQEGEPAGLK